MELQLSANDTSLALDGVRFTRTGLQFTEENPTERTVTDALRMLQLMDSVTEWGWADGLPRMVALHRSRSRRRVKPERARQMEMAAIAEFATMTGQDAAMLHEREKVGRFFPQGVRREKLTFAHHVEAWLHADGSLERACAWLDRAVTDALSVPQLRALIRREASQSSGQNGGRGAIDAPDLLLSDLELTAARRLRMVRAYDRERASAELEAMRNTVALVDELRRRAAA